MNNSSFHQILHGLSFDAYQLFGAHFSKEYEQSGVRFTVYAPNAKSVSLIGTFIVKIFILLYHKNLILTIDIYEKLLFFIKNKTLFLANKRKIVFFYLKDCKTNQFALYFFHKNL